MEILSYVIKDDEFIFGEKKEKYPLSNLDSYATFSAGGEIFRGSGVVLFLLSLMGCATGGVGGGIIAFFVSLLLFWIGFRRKREYLGLYFKNEDSRFSGEITIPILATKAMDEIHREIEKIDKIIEAKGLPKVNLLAIKV